MDNIEEKINNVDSKFDSKFNEIGGRIDSMEAMLQELLELMMATPAPTVSTPVPSSTPTVPPSICADKAGSWTIGNKTKPWCKIAAKHSDTLQFCNEKDLWDHCPVTCGRCS